MLNRDEVKKLLGATFLKQWGSPKSPYYEARNSLDDLCAFLTIAPDGKVVHVTRNKTVSGLEILSAAEDKIRKALG